jgi:hypothetical protein
MTKTNAPAVQFLTGLPGRSFLAKKDFSIVSNRLPEGAE